MKKKIVKNDSSKKYICVEQTRSLIGRSKKNKILMKGLGLSGIGKKVILQDNPNVRGIIFKVQHLISINVY